MATGSVLRDQNREPIWWGISSVDGVTRVPIKMNSVTHGVLMEIGTSTCPVMTHLNGSLPREENRVPCLGGQSNTDSTVIIPVSVNPATGAVLAQTT